MMDMLRKRRNDEEGFTLIELMVVVLIIAILLAIAIPTFLGARDRANNRAAQSSLRNALSAAKTLYTDNQDYSSASSANLAAIEPALTFVASGTSSTTFKTVSVAPGTSPSTLWTGAALSKTGTCYFVKDSTAASGGTTYSKVASAATCDAGSPPAAGTFSADVTVGW